MTSPHDHATAATHGTKSDSPSGQSIRGQNGGIFGASGNALGASDPGRV